VTLVLLLLLLMMMMDELTLTWHIVLRLQGHKVLELVTAANHGPRI